MKEKKGREIVARERRVKFQEKEGACIPRKNECTKIEEEGCTTRRVQPYYSCCIIRFSTRPYAEDNTYELGMIFKVVDNINF